MNIEPKLEKIFDKARSSIALTREDCAYLLSFDEKGYESALIRATANDVVRKKTDNSAIILGQIGVDVRPCPGRCKFCTFGELHTKFEPSKMSEEELERKMHEFCDEGDLYGLYLMTMHEYDLDNYLRIVEHARKVAPATTQIWANIGDSSYEDLKAIHDVGVSGIYHVCRLREGEDTELDPKDRIRTMENAKKAGLELYTCCEPIGPEHTIEELVENIFIGVEMGVYQHAAMRRVAVPGAPLAERGQISELRLAHIAACIALTSVTVPTLAYMGLHEPNELGYLSGSNIITAESGANPRDNTGDTSKGRGMDMGRCRKMLYECGFDYIRRGDESKIPLNFDYLIKTNSL